VVDREDHRVTLTDEGDPAESGLGQPFEAFLALQDPEARVVKW
jgi:hypothetical protein